MGMALEDRETRVRVMGTPLLFSVHTIDEAVTARAWLLVGLMYKTDGNAPVEDPGSVAGPGRLQVSL